MRHEVTLPADVPPHHPLMNFSPGLERIRAQWRGNAFPEMGREPEENRSGWGWGRTAIKIDNRLCWRGF